MISRAVARPRHLATLFIVLAALSFLAGCEGREDAQKPQTANKPDQATSSEHAARVDSQVAILRNLPDVVDQTLPSVVGISTKMKVDTRRGASPFGDDFPFPFDPGAPGGPDRGIREGMGSGVVVSNEGYILTNYHVVEGADEILVSLNERGEFTAEVVGTDPKSDLAVLQLQDPPEDLRPLPFADTEGVRLGEPVVAIGNPFGLASTVTMGIVSAKGRQNVGITDYEDFIQTDAAINPGNSGGPLVNMSGEIVGINTAILSRSGGYQGIGFAIPSRMARAVMESLIEHGKVTRGWLGVMIQTVTDDLARAFDLPKNTDGVIVSDVEPNSPAAEAGLRRGDVIVSLDGKSIDSASNLRNRVALTAPGTTVEMGVLRDGDQQTIEVELGELPSEAAGPPSLGPQSQLDGLSLAPINPELRQRFNIPGRLDRGVIVTNLTPGSPAAQMGLRPGDVVLEVNRERVDSVDAFSKAYDKSDARVLFLVYRDGSTLFLAADKPG
ncbi:DegQ family serine endoprotease [Persicimonas caeni]|uniref:DegQ family serine endoprotease n=1 Tax=Persicimonas caeni TaxID=2292766 RepID=A0A4Y6PZ89_PERCE|nr:DegQ family serine endoprotease [Persicimonas caeni]QDG53636.1 DegQ family serine endoprotease [Persicimonas caeni]QED34857.1 DegQ family serine endoprotease [Persicimonas caeni]